VALKALPTLIGRKLFAENLLNFRNFSASNETLFSQFNSITPATFYSVWRKGHGEVVFASYCLVLLYIVNPTSIIRFCSWLSRRFLMNFSLDILDTVLRAALNWGKIHGTSVLPRPARARVQNDITTTCNSARPIPERPWQRGHLGLGICKGGVEKGARKTTHFLK